MRKKRRNRLTYPSSVLLQSACYEDYKRIVDTYEKLYSKISIALGVSSAILLAILSSFDYKLLFIEKGSFSNGEMFFLFVRFLCSSISSCLIVCATIQLLLLVRSSPVKVFNSLDIRNERIYCYKEDEAALWLIKAYTEAAYELKELTNIKQKSFDSAILKLVISILVYIGVIITEKGI